MYRDISYPELLGIIAQAKVIEKQQERMHSNEEVLQIIFRFTNKFDLRKNIDISFEEQSKWFEQFKK